MAYSDLDAIHVPSAGNRPPASWGVQVNANFDAVYDDVLAKLGAWTTHTPTITQGVAVSKTTTYSRYLKLGRSVRYQGDLAITSSGTLNTVITVTLPVTAATSGLLVGQIRWYFSGATTNWIYAAHLGSTTAFDGFISGTALNVGQTSGSHPNQLLNGHRYLWDISYESAS